MRGARCASPPPRGAAGAGGRPRRPGSTAPMGPTPGPRPSRWTTVDNRPGPDPAIPGGRGGRRMPPRRGPPPDRHRPAPGTGRPPLQGTTGPRKAGALQGNSPGEGQTFFRGGLDINHYDSATCVPGGAVMAAEEDPDSGSERSLDRLPPRGLAAVLAAGAAGLPALRGDGRHPVESPRGGGPDRLPRMPLRVAGQRGVRAGICAGTNPGRPRAGGPR